MSIDEDKSHERFRNWFLKKAKNAVGDLGISLLTKEEYDQIYHSLQEDSFALIDEKHVKRKQNRLEAKMTLVGALSILAGHEQSRASVCFGFIIEEAWFFDEPLKRWFTKVLVEDLPHWKEIKGKSNSR